MAESSDELFIIVGIDFGTTHSGVAWTWSGRRDEVNIISIWDSDSTRSGEQVKVPTEICYHPNGDISWGLCAGLEPLKWFKLLLAEGSLQEGLSNCDILELTRSRMAGRTVVDVVADYLKLLWTYAVENIEKRLSTEAVAGMAFKIVITVPAVWDHGAQNAMKKAATKAGLLKNRPAGKTTLTFVSEPEAAALATLREFDGRPDIKCGDVFVVCDAGGGTVDLISYEVTQINPIKIKECVEGSGGLCGAVCLDDRFLSYMRTIMGPQDFKALGPSKQKELLEMNWEIGIKRNYDGSDKPWTVTIPSIGNKLLTDRSKDIENGRAIIKGGHVKQMFEPVCSRVRTLVRKQVAAVQEKTGKPPKAILLVGGFGSNKYLYTSLQKSYQHISIQQPSKSWSAVCRGALQNGINDRNVLSRVSRLNYGVKFDTDFIDGVHDPRDKRYDSIRGCFMATDQIRWYLRKGDSINSREPVKFKWAKYFKDPVEYQGGLRVNLFQSNVKNAPERTTKDVKPLCTIKCSLLERFDSLEYYTNAKGNVSRRLYFELMMLVEGTSLGFVVHLDGVMMARERVGVEY